MPQRSSHSSGSLMNGRDKVLLLCHLFGGYFMRTATLQIADYVRCPQEKAIKQCKLQISMNGPRQQADAFHPEVHTYPCMCTLFRNRRSLTSCNCLGKQRMSYSEMAFRRSLASEKDCNRLLLSLHAKSSYFYQLRHVLLTQESPCLRFHHLLA